MELRKKIKQNARHCLQDNWGKAIAITLFFFAIHLFFFLAEQLFCYAAGMDPHFAHLAHIDWFYGRITISEDFLILTGIFALISFLILTPLDYGITKWYYQRAGGKEASVHVLFDGFFSVRVFFRCLGLKLMRSLRIAAVGVVCAAPSFGLWLLAQYFADYTGFYAVVARLGTLLLMIPVTLVMLALLLRYALRYFLSNYLLVLDQENRMPLHAILSESATEMKGHGRKTFFLCLSFFPWLLLAPLLFPLLFIIPYLLASLALQARIILKRNERERAERHSESELSVSEKSEPMKDLI